MPRGVRLDPNHDQRTRAKIQTSQIINALFKHVKSENKMTSTQVRAAEILLKKTLPDLSAVEATIKPKETDPEEIQQKDKELLASMGIKI